MTQDIPALALLEAAQEARNRLGWMSDFLGHTDDDDIGCGCRMAQPSDLVEMAQATLSRLDVAIQQAKELLP